MTIIQPIGLVLLPQMVVVSRTETNLQLVWLVKIESICRNFLQFLNAENEISIIDYYVTCTSNKKQYPASSITIYNNKICSDLQTYGIVDNKSKYNIDFLEKIPEKFKFACICGLFDGDGWFTNTKKSYDFGFCGNELTVDAMRNYLNDFFKWKTSLNLLYYKKSPTVFYIQTQSMYKIVDFIQEYLKLQDKCDLLQRKYDNALDILQKLQTKIAFSQHKKLEIKKDWASLTFQYNKKCPVCQKEYYTQYEDQIHCSQQCAHVAQQRVERPSREELKSLIRNHSFLALGRKYGVSDNAIRKWCKAMNLPYKTTDIKKYDQQEWDKI